MASTISFKQPNGFHVAGTVFKVNLLLLYAKSGTVAHAFYPSIFHQAGFRSIKLEEPIIPSPIVFNVFNAKLASTETIRITIAHPSDFVSFSTSSTTRVSVASDGTQGNGNSWHPSISADGRYVAFHSYASNLISDDTNGQMDVFVHDRQTSQTTRVSVSSDGVQGGDTNVDSDIFVDNTVDVFVRDQQTGRITLVASCDFRSYLSASGRYLALF